MAPQRHGPPRSTVAIDDATYPAELLRLPRPPPALFVRGTIPARDVPWIAVVGSRAAYREDRGAARALAARLADAGCVVVSGGALGIDAAAHRGALDAGGVTVAVLGGGLDRPYPQRNVPLFRRIADAGALLSTYPPDTPPRRAHFPQRNGVLAALGRALVVVAAERRSGALNSASWARQLGRPVAARCGTPGCRELVRRGALPLRDDERDVERLLRLAAGQAAPPDARRGAEEQRLLASLRHAPLDLAEAARRAGLGPGRAAALLLRLELAGLVTATADGRFVAQPR